MQDERFVLFGGFSVNTIFLRKLIVILLFIACLGSFILASNQIVYSLENSGPGQWKAVYEVRNISLAEPIREFTIWFDYGLYSNLSIEKPSPLNTAWDEIIYNPYLQPPLAPFNGCYDALALDEGIAAGQFVSGFAITFDWLGSGLPAVQRYEILNPQTFETLAQGQTVYIPEPASLLLLLTGAVYLNKKQKR
jgi:hypothetical protein